MEMLDQIPQALVDEDDEEDGGRGIDKFPEFSGFLLAGRQLDDEQQADAEEVTENQGVPERDPSVEKQSQEGEAD
jgi:hypothetical protein